MKINLKSLAFLVASTGSILVSNGSLLAEQSPADEETELAKKLNNPIASLISVPFQANEDFNIGPTGKGYKFTLNIQPVIPISLGKDWNVIVRTILPEISQHDVYYRNVPNVAGAPSQNRSQDGLGDITQRFFFSPKEPRPGGIIWGLGPVFLYPSATQDLLGGGKWGMGPTFVLLKQTGPWTVGALANQIWSVGGSSDRSNISAAFLQPWPTRPIPIPPSDLMRNPLMTGRRASGRRRSIYR